MKKLSKLTTLTLALAMGVTLIPGGIAGAKKVAVKKVTVTDSLTGNSKLVTVAKGKTVKLTANVKVSPNKAADKKVAYKSKDKKIATVSSKGVVKGIKAGSTSITVTSKKNAKKKAVIKVKVVKGCVTGVKLDNKLAALNVGDKLQLKAVIKAGKGADKTLLWTSSKSKVAEVNGKGMVTALTEGTTTVTAQATDGSGIKASCKITVQNTTDITEVKVVDPQTVTFKLSRGEVLTKDNVTIYKKYHYEGGYRNQAVIENLTTADNVNYTVTLDRYNHVSEKQFVQVSIPVLSGKVKQMETEYLEPVNAYVSEEIWTMKVNEYFNEEIEFYNGMGLMDMVISGLPAGLEAKREGEKYRVSGIPKATGVTSAKIQATDEYGDTFTKDVKIVVGSDEELAGAACTCYEVLGTNYTPVYDYTEDVRQADGTVKYIYHEGAWKAEHNFMSGYVEVAGGSGNYEYALAPDGDPAGIVQAKDNTCGVKSDGSFEYKVPQAGIYSVTVRVTDKVSKKYIDVAVPINVAASITVSGRITDAQGEGMRGAHVEFANKNKAERYPGFAHVYTDINGNYSVNILPGTYTVEVSNDNSGNIEESSGYKYMYNKNFTQDTTGCDAQLPLYRVHITNINVPQTTADGKPVEPDINNTYTYPDGTTKPAIMSLFWYYNNRYIGYRDYLYLKPGQYTLEAEKYVDNVIKDDGRRYNIYDKYTVSFNVVNSAVEAAATVSKVEEWDPTYAGDTK